MSNDLQRWARSRPYVTGTGPRGGKFYITSGGSKVYGDPPEGGGDLASQIIEIAKANPYGFSWRPDTKSAASGIMVSAHPNRDLGKEIAAKDVTKMSELRGIVTDWLAKVAPYVMKNPELHFGGWIDTDKTKNFYLDVSRRYPKEEREKAIAKGTKNNQIAVWDIDKMDSIGTGGTGKRIPSAQSAANERAPRRR
jgi:hypothetical protein